MMICRGPETLYLPDDAPGIGRRTPVVAACLVLVLALVGSTYHALFRERVAAPRLRSAFEQAVLRGDTAAVARLLREGAKVNTYIEPPFRPCPPKCTPLSFAVFRGDAKMTRLLLQYGADPNSRLAFPWPLLLAVDRGDLPMARLLLHAGANPNRVSCYQVSAMRTAVENGDRPMIQLLRSAGAVPLSQLDAEAKQVLASWQRSKVGAR